MIKEVIMSYHEEDNEWWGMTRGEEVTRCKDCEYMLTSLEKKKWCTRLPTTVFPVDEQSFCAWPKPKI